MPKFSQHIFVCTNERDAGNPRGDCKSKGSEAIRNYLKKEIGTRGLNDRMRANVAGCLDQCERGVAVVIYPEAVWYTLHTVEDAKAVFDEHLIGGKIVDRLLMRDA